MTTRKTGQLPGAAPDEEAAAGGGRADERRAKGRDRRPRRRIPRWMIVLAVVTFVALVISGVNLAIYYYAGPPPISPPATGATPEETLAARYAPVVYLRRQSGPCDRKGEAYPPAPVETVLGNPAVVLRQVSKDGGPDPVIVQGPTAADLAGKDANYYLDLPGQSRTPGCGYEQDSKARMEGREPVVYAHLVREPGTDQLALQYWFFYYFDDFVNTHEGDWEMIQLVFDATTATAALENGPSLVAYAQHGGGETASWRSPKVQQVDGRPVAYPAAGSHATYYSNNLYIGWGKDGTGFGCDNAAPPSDLVLPRAILLPDDVQPDSPYAWLLFGGRWGERGAGPFNGPSGPQTSGQWRQPISWMNGLRPASIEVPSVPGVGPSVTDIFCNVTGQASGVIASFTSNPVVTVLIALILLAILVGVVAVMRQTLRDALALYRRHWVTFVLLSVPLMLLALVIDAAHLLAHLMLGNGRTTNQALRDVAGSASNLLQTLLLLCLVIPAVAWTTARIQSGRPPSLGEAYRRVMVRLPVLLGSLLALNFGPLALLVAIVGLALAATYLIAPAFALILVVALPFYLWLTVRWIFFSQAVLIDHARTVRQALAGSSRVVRGHWLRVAISTAIFIVVASVPGPLIGLILLLLLNRSVEFANTLGSLVYAASVPFAVVGQTLLYLRLHEQDGAEAMVATTNP